MNNKRLLLISVILMLFIISISSANAGEINTAEDLTINEELAIDNGESITLNENNENIDNNLINEDDAVSIDSSDELEDANFENIEQSDNNKESSVLSDSNSITVTDRTFPGIQTAIDNATVGSTLILDGYYGGDGTLITIAKSLNFVGIHDATLDANHLGGIFRITGAGVTFNNVTFQNGNTSKGGVISSLVNLTIVNCSFVNNSASENGGAIYLQGNNSIFGCTFVNNSAKYGGAIYLRNTVSLFNYYAGTTYISDCSFENNSANGIAQTSLSWNGGAIYFGGNGSVSGCSFVNNSAKQSSGAIAILDNGSVINCTFMKNNSTTGIAGAIRVSENGSVINCTFENNYCDEAGAAVYMAGGSVVNCSFVNNSANKIYSYAGAVYMAGGSVVNCSFVNNSDKHAGAGAVYMAGGSVVNCSFVNNSAEYGGAVYMAGGSVVNCSFVNNSASSNGGAICINNGVLSIVNCSFVNNSASSNGGAIYTDYGCSVVNCSFVNNSANSYGAICWSGNGSVVNCSFVNNSANSYGAISISNLTEIFHCFFKNNTAQKNPNSNLLIKSDDLSFVLGDECILMAYLYDAEGPLINYMVNFKLNYLEYNVATDLEGIAYLNVTNILTEVGKYSVNINFAGDELFYSAYKNVTVDVHQYYDSKLFLNNLTFFKGKDGILVANLSDSRGPLANHLLTFNINGEDVNVTTDSSGLARINLKTSFIDLGNYTVNVSFAGDGYDTPTSAAATVNVIKDTPILSVNNLNILINNDGNLIADLYDSSGPLTNHSLSFIIGNTTLNQTTDSRGKVTINVKSYLTKAGEYVVNVSFAGDDYDDPVSTNATVIVNKYTPTLTVNNLSVVLDDNCNLIANLSDSRGKLSSKTITFSVNGHVINGTTNNKGSVTVNVKDYVSTIGEHTVTVSFAGDDYDYEVSANATVIINKYTPALAVNDLSVVLDDDAILKANLSNRNGPLSGKNITFTVNGENITKSTISSGVATLNIKSYLTELGVYDVGVIFEGDDFNYPVSTNAIVNVNHYIATLTVSQVGKYYGDTSLVFNLTDNKTNKGISDANIELIFSNGLNLALVTDSDGVAIFDMPFVPRTYNVSASVIDSNVDVNNVSLDNFEIKSRTGIIEITQNSTGYNKSALFIKLYNDVTGDVYRNIKVDIDFVELGLTSEAVTNDEGIAVYDIPFDIGTYYVYVIVSERYAEFESAEKDDVTIVKSESIIIFEDDIGLVVGGSGSTNFTAIGCSVDQDNIGVIDHPEAIISLFNNVISVSNLAAGNYTLEVITSPDSNHNSVSAYVNVTVYESAPSTIVFEGNISFDYGSSGSTNFTVIGGSVNEANVSVVDHPEAVISLSDNIISVSNLTVGNYTLEVISSPDFRHSSTVSHVTIIVDKADSYMEFTNDVVFDWGSSGSTTLILNGCSINQDNVTILDGNGVVCKDVVIALNGNKITVSNLSVGSYTLEIVSSPDSNHNSINRSCNITVNRVSSAISFTDVQFEYQSEGSTTLMLSGCTVDEENVRVIGSDGTPYSNVVRLDGNNLTIFNLPIGEYSLVITTTPDGNHSAVTGDASITVTEMASNVIFNNDASVDVGKVAILNLTVVGGTIDIGSLSISGQSPTFEIEKVGDDYLVYISNLPVGTHTLKVTTIPDSLYYSVSKYCVINVKDPRTNTSISWGSKSMKFTYGGSGSVTVAVTGGTLSANNIVVVGHKEAVIKYSSGKITVSNLTVGTYTLKVTPTADANHIAKAQNITVTVTKIPAVITAKAITVYYKNTKKWSIKLINNSTKKAMASKVIVLKLYTGTKYATYKVKTNSKGIATFSIPKTLKLGTHKVVLSYSNSYATCKALTSKIVVKKQALTINIGFQKFTDGSRTVDIIVKDKATKKALNKIKVKVLVYTGTRVTKTYTKLVTAYYKHNKENGFAMYGGGIKAFGSAGTHKIVVKPVDTKYSGQSNAIKISVPKSAKSIKTFVVSSGKVSILK